MSLTYFTHALLYKTAEEKCELSHFFASPVCTNVIGWSCLCVSTTSNFRTMPSSHKFAKLILLSKFKKPILEDRGINLKCQAVSDCGLSVLSIHFRGLHLLVQINYE